jgi:hypothetical protein
VGHFNFISGHDLSTVNTDVHLCTFTNSLYGSFHNLTRWGLRKVSTSCKCGTALRTFPDAGINSFHGISTTLRALVLPFHFFSLYLPLFFSVYARTSIQICSFDRLFD